MRNKKKNAKCLLLVFIITNYSNTSNKHWVLSPEFCNNSCLICLIPLLLVLGSLDASNFVSSISFVTKFTFSSRASSTTISDTIVFNRIKLLENNCLVAGEEETKLSLRKNIKHETGKLRKHVSYT